MARRRRRGEQGDGAVHMDERWAVSYLDMMTVLFLTFVVLYAMSDVNAAKYEMLKNSLATGFGQEKTVLDDTDPGVLTENPGEELEAGAAPLTAEQKLDEIRTNVSQNLQGMDRQADVEFDYVNGALVIRVVSGETLFTPDNAELSSSARELLSGITPAIQEQDGSLTVEGHADYLVPLNYDSNWELSTDRAVKVVRHMVESQGLAPDHASAAGFGSTRPLGGQKDALDRNRRVDIVVLAEDDPGAPGAPATTASAAGQ